MQEEFKNLLKQKVEFYFRKYFSNIGRLTGERFVREIDFNWKDLEERKKIFRQNG